MRSLPKPPKSSGKNEASVDFRYEVKGGEKIGRDPRTLRVQDLNQMGHEKHPILHVIRAKCLDCCCGEQAEVRKCTSFACPLWPYRMQTNPFTLNKGNAAGLMLASAARST